MKGQTVVFEIVDHILLVCTGDDPPTDEEFSQMVHTISNLGTRVTGILVMAGKRRPTSSQRSQMVSILRKRELGVAMVSDSRMARGAITAIGWFVSRVKSFRVDELEQALRFLDVEPAHLERFLLKLRSLHATLDPPRTERATAAKSGYQ